MEARITFKPSTLKQTGTIGKILMWCQDNPRFLKDTSISSLAGLISVSEGLGYNNVKCMLTKMVNNQFLTRWGGRRRSHFMINYYHKDIPGYILDRAPDDVREKVKAMKENLTKNQYITDEGCIVTKPPVKKEEPKPVETKAEVKEDDETKEDATEPSVSVATLVPPEDVKTEIATPVSVEKDGKNISITINLNLNLGDA